MVFLWAGMVWRGIATDTVEQFLIKWRGQIIRHYLYQHPHTDKVSVHILELVRHFIMITMSVLQQIHQNLALLLSQTHN